MHPTFPADWKIVRHELIAETFSSRIWKVWRAHEGVAVVKDLKPIKDIDDELRGSVYLHWRDGTAAVRLLGLDGTRMLVEFAGDRTLTHQLDEFGDAAATEIAAETTARLVSDWRSPTPATLQPLRVYFRGLFEVAKCASGAEVEIYRQAASLAQRLLDDTRHPCPLHADLHHNNLIFGPRGWLAIDPKGVVGDPAFDCANFFYNPLERDDLCLDHERIARMAVSFARTTRIDPRRILDQAFAYGCLSAAWHREDANTADETRELAVAAAIATVRDLNF